MKNPFLSQCVVVFLSLLLPVIQTQKTNTHKKTQIQTTRTLFGVQLSPAATKLLNKVETRYGSPIQPAEGSLDLLFSDAYGQCDVEKNGVPKIEINPANGRTEATIVHELMHLLDIADGVRYPLLGWHPHSPIPQQVRDFIIMTADQVEHAFFFPKLIKMGLDSTTQGKDAIRGQIQQHRYRTESDELREANLALVYFQCAAVLQDKVLADNFETNEFLPGDEKARRLGRSAVEILTKSKFVTPDDETTVYIELCNTFLEGYYRLTLTGFDEEQRGKITMKYAKVKVEPVVPKGS